MMSDTNEGLTSCGLIKEQDKPRRKPEQPGSNTPSPHLEKIIIETTPHICQAQ